MKKNEDRKLAEMTFLKERGRVTNKELARTLNIHPATVARWKKLDEWDLKLVQAVTTPEETAPESDDFHGKDLQHIALLNERIDTYLRKQELLPSEIRELAEAKLFLVNCLEIIESHMAYPAVDEYGEEDRD
jgi:hypothetical protein